MKDIFGSALMACYRGEREPIILCREDGRKDEFDLQGLFTSYHEWPECERRAFAHVKGRVLDIGCGPGRHALSTLISDLMYASFDDKTVWPLDDRMPEGFECFLLHTAVLIRELPPIHMKEWKVGLNIRQGSATKPRRSKEVP